MDGSSFFAHNPSDSTERRSEKFAIFLVAGACSVAGICWGLMYYLIYGLSLTAGLPLSFTILVGGALFSSQSHGLEKIKTIGDAYMCAGGLPEVSRTHAIDCTLAGLEMISCVARTKQKRQGEGEPYWDMRIGIHAGPLVAGVVGARKFAYDLWGDTVNTAARMESGGSPGRLNVSAATYAEVRFLFECEHRGKVTAKGKGEVDMFYVNRIKPQFSEGGHGLLPNPRFHEISDRLKAGAKLVLASQHRPAVSTPQVSPA